MKRENTSLKELNNSVEFAEDPTDQNELGICIDRNKFEEIYAEYWETLYAIGFNRIKSRAEVEDIIQEIFIELWNRKTVHVKRDLKVYLFTAMKYKVIDYYRKAKIDEISLDTVATTQTNVLNAEQLISFNELYDELSQGIENLPDRCKLIFKMSREQGMTSAQIANHLQLSKRTVETQIYKSLKSIKRDMGDYALMLLIFLRP